MTNAAEEVHRDGVQPPLPNGTWTVDSQRSEIGFAMKGMWGLATVRGSFDTYNGRLRSRDGEADGELTIIANSLRTGNAKRDKHLRSEDFFDVERHPTITFKARRIEVGENGPAIAGELALAGSRVPLRIPVSVKHEPQGALQLAARTSVARPAVGLEWNWLGSIRGDAELHVRLALVPSARG